MVRVVDSMLRLCPRICASPHLDDHRSHLPLVLVRATHDGAPYGDTGPTSQLDPDGSMWPRYHESRPLNSRELGWHLNKKSRNPTQFLSFTTWYHLHSRIETWKKAGVRNIRIHFVLTPALSGTTEIYRATGLINRFNDLNLKEEEWNGEEYLLRGHVDPAAIISSISCEGEDVLTGIPLFAFRYKEPILNRCLFKQCLVLLPMGFFYNENNAQRSLRERQAAVRKFIRNSTEILESRGNEDPPCRMLLDALTRGKFFTVRDWEVHRREIGA